MSDKPTILPKGRFQLKYRGTECLNCGHQLDISDKYCPNCSQSNSTKKLALKDFFDEFFSSLVNYDSKLLKTLSALLLRPGKITLDYIQGKRIAYTNPFRFLLSLGIIYFLLLNFTGNFTELDKLGMTEKGIPLNTKSDFEVQLKIDGEERSATLSELDSMGFYEKLNASVAKRDSLIMLDPAGHFRKINDSAFFKRHSLKQDFFNTLLRKDLIENFEDATAKYQIGTNLENKISFASAKSFEKILRQPGSFTSSLISRLPFATFLFLPIFAVFITLVYIRKKYTYTDNLVFSFHNQALLFILLIVSFLVDHIFNIESAWIFLLAFLFYLYKAMRKFYGEGRFKTILKFVFLNAIFFILAIVAALVLVIGSAFTF